eukprot:478529-Pleurochrysis_carterae.AAC.1
MPPQLAFPLGEVPLLSHERARFERRLATPMADLRDGVTGQITQARAAHCAPNATERAACTLQARGGHTAYPEYPIRVPLICSGMRNSLFAWVGSHCAAATRSIFRETCVQDATELPSKCELPEHLASSVRLAQMREAVEQKLVEVQSQQACATVTRALLDCRKATLHAQLFRPPTSNASLPPSPSYAVLTLRSAGRFQLTPLCPSVPDAGENRAVNHDVCVQLPARAPERLAPR